MCILEAGQNSMPVRFCPTNVSQPALLHHQQKQPIMTPVHQILFLDVETVSQHPRFDQLDDHGRALWEQKISFLARRDDHPWSEAEYAQSYSEKAAIYAEFGKVIVISAGLIHGNDPATWTLRIKSFYGDSEEEVLKAFVQILDKNFNDPFSHSVCGHNIREFDIPYLCRRLTAHRLDLPVLFNIAGKKPWEVKHIVDTLELWKFGDHKNFTSLDLLSYTLGIPSPKDAMDGSMVGEYYWEKEGLHEIKTYCEKDVLAVAQVYLRMHNLPLLTAEQVVFTN
jgi:predicted PolB exonuclease-like 3'-5' exonuclease